MTRYEEIIEQVATRHDDGCWPFPSVGGEGYAMLWHNGGMVKACIVAYELRYGPVPEGLELDHLCCNRWCYNPDHVEPVTHAENIRRSGKQDTNSHKTHCPQGHPYDEKNTYWSHTGRHSGWQRVCRACKRKYMRRRRDKNAAIH